MPVEKSKGYVRKEQLYTVKERRSSILNKRTLRAG